MRRLIVFLSAALSGCAPVQPKLSLVDYLGLTGAQVTSLRESAASFNRLYQEKARRYQELARDLATEANRTTPNANALGQRYVEQQLICRELRAAHQANYGHNQTVLSAEQKRRLRVFDDAISHNNLALNAGFEFLMEEPTSGVAFASIGGTPMSTAPNPGKPLCGVPMIAPIGGQAQ